MKKSLDALRTSGDASVIIAATAYKILSNSRSLQRSCLHLLRICVNPLTARDLITPERADASYANKLLTILTSLHYAHISYNAFSASLDRKVLVSAIFRKRMVRIFSISRSNNRGIVYIISWSTSKLFLAKEERKESPHFNTLTTSILVFSLLNILLLCFSSLLNVFRISNYSDHSCALALMHFANSASGLEIYSRSDSFR